MNFSDDQPTRLDDAIAAYLDFLDGAGPEPDLTDMGPDERQAFDTDVATLHALRALEYESALLEDDPVAIRFGFDRVTSDIALSGTRLRAIRKQAQFLTGQLAAAVTEAGHPTSTAELFNLEQSTSIVSVAFGGALAAILGTSVADLEAPDSALLSDLDAFVASREFDAEVTRWARQLNVDRAALHEDARRELAGARFRNVRHSPEQWFALLHAFLEERS